MSGKTNIMKIRRWLAAGWAKGLVPAADSLGSRWRLLRPGGMKKLRSSFAEVETLAAELQGVSAALENRFLESATILLELDGQGGRFVKHSEQLVNVATGRTGGAEVFHGALEVVNPPLNFLNDSHAQMKALLGRLTHDNERIAGLINGRTDLQRTMAPLKYIQTSFRIEAAPLGEEVQMMFSALTQEIEKLHIQVCEVFTTKYEELQQIQLTIQQVIRKLEEQTEEVWRNIAQEKQHIDATLVQLQSGLADNQRREIGIAKLSSQVARGIQEVVTGLQFQDIISQRLQHTTTALLEIGEQLDGSDDSIEFMEQACRLETEQIKSVRHDLAGAEKTVRQGIKNVLDQIIAVDEKCVSLEEYENLTVSANGMVQVLLDVFATLQKQIDATVSGCHTANEILRPIGGMASNLTMVVNELSQRIHLIGLNAQVQAAQVPDGMGLEVLSARTSEISRETNRISDNMAGQLDRLVEGLAESLQALGQLHQAASEQKAALGQKGGVCETQLHGLRDLALTSLTEVHELLDGIRAKGESVLGAVNYVATADDTLQNLQRKLGAAAFQAARQLGDRHSGENNRIGKLTKEYTMASERHVFESTLKPGGSSSKVLRGDITGSEETVDCLFTDAAAASTAASRLPDVVGVDASVELF